MAEATAATATRVVAAGADAAAAAATMAAPTLPLKISLTQIQGPATKSTPHPALARSHHTLTVINDQATIFGGRHDSDSPEADASESRPALCPPAIHILTLPTNNGTTLEPPTTYQTAYTCYPPFTLQDAFTGETLVPSARQDHAACAGGGGRFLLVHGGRDAAAAGRAIDEGSCLWRWDWEQLSWAKLRGDSQQLGVAGGMRPRWGHWIFADEPQGFLVLVGGKGEEHHGGGGGMAAEEGEADTETEVWMYDFNALAWTTLPRAPAKPLAAAYVRGTVYIVSRDAAGDRVAVHCMDMRESPTEREKPGALVWQTVTVGADPQSPRPKPREGGALVPLTTGHGREYLVYMFGRSAPDVSGDEPGLEYFSDIWTLQLPTKGFSLASAKDKIQKEMPAMASGEFRWAEAEIVPTEQMIEGGKVHPGPRAFFGADTCLGGRRVVLWGGVNAKGENEGDGWIVRLAYGYADSDRWE